MLLCKGRDELTRVGVEGSWEVLASLYVFAAIEKGGLPGYVFKSRIDSSIPAGGVRELE